MMNEECHISGRPVYLAQKDAFFRTTSPLAAESVHDVTRRDTAWGVHSCQPVLTVAVILEGSMRYEWGGRKALLKPGMGFVTTPGSAVAFGNTDKRIYRKLFVGFGGCAMHAFASACFPESGPFTLESPVEIERRVDSLYRKLAYATGGAAASEMKSLKYAIAEESLTLLTMISETRSLSARYPAALENALNFIESRFVADISIGDIAGHAGVSLTSLRRMFAEHIGVSPLKKLTAARLSHAELLLSGGTMSIKKASRRSGFSSPLQFYRARKNVKPAPGCVR